MSNLRVIIVAVAIAITACLLCYIAGYTVGEHQRDNMEIPHDTAYIEPDTIPHQPVVKDSIQKDSVPYPVPVYLPGPNDTITDTITVYAMIPITQKHFVYEEKGEFWVSGFNATIDSAVFFTHHEIHYIEKPVKQKPLLCYGGAEYEYFGMTYDWKLFLEANYNIGRMSIGARGGVAIFTDATTPYVAACLKFRLN